MKPSSDMMRDGEAEVPSVPGGALPGKCVCMRYICNINRKSAQFFASHDSLRLSYITKQIHFFSAPPSSAGKDLHKIIKLYHDVSCVGSG